MGTGSARIRGLAALAAAGLVGLTGCTDGQQALETVTAAVAASQEEPPSRFRVEARFEPSGSRAQVMEGTGRTDHESGDRAMTGAFRSGDFERQGEQRLVGERAFVRGRFFLADLDEELPVEELADDQWLVLERERFEELTGEDPRAGPDPDALLDVLSEASEAERLDDEDTQEGDPLVGYRVVSPPPPQFTAAAPDDHELGELNWDIWLDERDHVRRLSLDIEVETGDGPTTQQLTAWLNGHGEPAAIDAPSGDVVTVEQLRQSAGT